MEAHIEQLADGRRGLRLALGSITVHTVEIPGRCLRPREWAVIQLARRSYAAMWGTSFLAEDRFDGRRPSMYDTKHYIAWVNDAACGRKMLTMRKVSINSARLAERLLRRINRFLPPDIRFWVVAGDSEARCNLWDVLTAHARRMAPDDPQAEFRIATLSRTGTFPYGERNKTRRMREQAAIAFSSIQLLASDLDADLLYVSFLCPEFQDKVLGIVDLNGGYVAPANTRTDEILGVAPGSTRMDNRLPAVREYKAKLPGYLIDNGSAAVLIARMLESGSITVADLQPTIAHLVEQEMTGGRDGDRLVDLLCAAAAGDHAHVAEFLTQPCMFKYMVPRIVSDAPLARMSGAEFRDCLIDQTSDGPFSSTRTPQDWLASAQRVLSAAREKYG